MSNTEPVQTARLLLRQWRDSDRDPYAAMCADPAVMEFFPAPLSSGESCAMIDRMRIHIDTHGWGLWAVESKAGERFIGFVGLNPTNPDLPFSPAVEIGWRLTRESWGNGYATEAAMACLQVGFEEFALEEIVSFTSTLNTRSMAVMRRIGLKNRYQDFEHPALPPGHRLSDHVLYGLDAKEWQVGPLG